MERKFMKKLENWKKNNILTPLMVVGARQIGKTYIINEFCEKNFDDYVYINLADRIDVVEIFDSKIPTKDKISKMELSLNKKIKENTIVFIDEIQESESLIAALKYFCECDFPYKIICAGSLLGVKLKRFQKSFPVGKVRILNMYPMDFEEFLMANNYQMAIDEIKKCYQKNIKMEESIHTKLLEYYRLYLCTGGMPQSIENLIKNNLSILDYDTNILRSIINSYIADMKKYTLNYSEAIKIERVYKNIPNQLAKENKKFQYSKIDKNARKRDYESAIEWLLASEMIIECKQVNKAETPLKAFSDSDRFKLYLSDVGLLTATLEIPYNKILLDQSFMYKGALAENYVVQTLLANEQPFYYWTNNRFEVDFLLDLDEGIIPIEVKAGENVKSTSLNQYIQKNKPKYAIIISTKNFGMEGKIKSVPLYATFCIKRI